MPELPEVEAVRRELAPVLHGARLVNVLTRRSGLRRRFPRNFVRRLCGCRVDALRRRGKYLLVDLSSGDTLVVHLGMSGSFRVEPLDALPQPHDHVVFELAARRGVVYNDPRRFGSMDVIATDRLQTYPPFRGMGPEPLSNDFEGASLARACAGRRTSIKVALLDQRVVAGLGNIYAVEALHLAGISPRRHASVLATATGTPRLAAHRLAGAIKAVLRKAIARETSLDRDDRFRVYDRDGEPCVKAGCGGTIRRLVQAGRSTFYCPVCQRG